MLRRTGWNCHQNVHTSENLESLETRLKIIFDFPQKVRLMYANVLTIFTSSQPQCRLSSMSLYCMSTSTSPSPPFGSRYAAELFYMAPLYHLAFTSLTKMIVIDATDLEFHGTLQLLQEEMDQVLLSRPYQRSIILRCNNFLHVSLIKDDC